MSSKLLSQPSKHLVNIIQNVRVSKSNDLHSECVNDVRPQLIVILLSLVYRPINFDYQFHLMTVEISHKESTLAVNLKTNWMLPQKFLAIQFPISNRLPDHRLSCRLILSQISDGFLNQV